MGRPAGGLDTGVVAFECPPAWCAAPDRNVAYRGSVPRSFASIVKAAQKRKGGPIKLKALLPAPPASAAKLRRLDDARALSALGKGIFRAGFSWKVVDDRWPAIEKALGGMRPEHVASLGGPEIEAYLRAPGVIKNRGRLQAVIENARWFLDVRDQFGSFGRMVAQWPSSEIVELWQKMKDEGSRIGGSTGPYFLRELGKDSWLPTGSVMRGLVAFKVLDRPGTGKRNLRDAQAAFNAWHEETGRSYAELSRIVAMSIPD